MVWLIGLAVVMSIAVVALVVIVLTEWLADIGRERMRNRNKE